MLDKQDAERAAVALSDRIKHFPWVASSRVHEIHLGDGYAPIYVEVEVTTRGDWYWPSAVDNWYWPSAVNGEVEQGASSLYGVRPSDDGLLIQVRLEGQAIQSLVRDDALPEEPQGEVL